MRFAIAIVGVCVLGVASLVAIDPLSREPIESRGGRIMLMRPIETPHYLQTDPRWARQLLGRTIEPMSLSGCTVCCLSMALARYDIDIPPGELNRILTASNGFTDHGWLKWSTVTALTNGRVEVATPLRADHDDLDEAISKGWPVVTKIRLKGDVTHWVLVVGKNGTQYQARDPLVPGRMVTLSERSPVIESIRIVRPTAR